MSVRPRFSRSQELLVSSSPCHCQGADEALSNLGCYGWPSHLPGLQPLSSKDAVSRQHPWPRPGGGGFQVKRKRRSPTSGRSLATDWSLAKRHFLIFTSFDSSTSLPCRATRRGGSEVKIFRVLRVVRVLRALRGLRLLLLSLVHTIRPPTEMGPPGTGSGGTRRDPEGRKTWRVGDGRSGISWQKVVRAVSHLLLVLHGVFGLIPF